MPRSVAAVAEGLPVYVSEVPEYEPRGDCIYVAWRGLEFYMPVPIAKAAMGRFHRALDQWHEERDRPVVPFSPPQAVAAE